MARRPKMELKDIVTKVTTLTNDYINKGYIFNPGTMGGSQGEMVRIDLTKDLEDGPVTIRLVIDKVVNYLDDYYRFTVEEFNKPFSDDKLDILWNGSGLYLLDEYYGIKQDGSIFYMGTEDDIKKAWDKRRDRWMNKHFDYPTEEVSSKYYGTIRSIVSRFDVPGWKRFSIKSVTTWKDVDGSIDYLVYKPNGTYFRFFRTGSKVYYHTNN